MSIFRNDRLTAADVAYLSPEEINSRSSAVFPILLCSSGSGGVVALAFVGYGSIPFKLGCCA
jgi:hypothetical protein